VPRDENGMSAEPDGVLIAPVIPLARRQHRPPLAHIQTDGPEPSELQWAAQPPAGERSIWDQPPADLPLQAPSRAPSQAFTEPRAEARIRPGRGGLAATALVAAAAGAGAAAVVLLLAIGVGFAQPNRGERSAAAPAARVHAPYRPGAPTGHASTDRGRWSSRASAGHNHGQSARRDASHAATNVQAEAAQRKPRHSATAPAEPARSAAAPIEPDAEGAANSTVEAEYAAAREFGLPK
jgi:hypothetical protein